MTKLKQYYATVRQLEATLPEIVFLASVINTDKNFTVEGSVSECSREVAARRITDGTHRLAKPEEVEAFEDAQDKNLEITERTERRRATRYTREVEDEPMRRPTRAQRPASQDAEPATPATPLA